MTEKLFKNALLIQIFSVVVGVIGMVVDGAVTGRCLGTDYMAAYGLVTPVATIFAACASVVGIGTSVLVGRIVGARKMDEASGALSTCLFSALALAAVLIVVISFFSHEIAGLMGAKGVLNEMASDYLRGFCLCAPAMLMLMIFIPVVQIDGNGTIIITSIVSMTAVNITGDLLNGLVIHAGLWGMALSTTISYFVALFVILIPFIRKKNTISFTVHGLKMSYALQMLKGGMPDALQQICQSLLLIVFNNLLLKIADHNSVAILTAIVSAANLCLALGSGVAASTSMLTSVFAGEEDDKAIRELMRVALRKSILYNAVLCVALLAGAGFVMPMFLSDEGLMQGAILGFRLYCLSMIGYSINVTFRSYYQAMRFSLLSSAYVIFNTFIFKVAGAFLLSSFMGENGVFLAYAFGETVTLIAITVVAMIASKDKKGFLEKYLFIPSEFSSSILERFDQKATDCEEVEAVSAGVFNFCINNGSGRRDAYIMSLAVEEIGVRSLASAKSIEVRVLCKKDNWTLRIRDDGKRFNPLELMKDENEDDFSRVGIKTLEKMISDMDYTNTLNMNNLNIKLAKEA